MDRPNPRAYLGLVVLLSQGRGFCAACWWLRCATRVARSYCLSSTLRTLPMRRSNTTPTEDHSDTVRHVSLLLPLARYILSLCVRLSVCQSVRLPFHSPAAAACGGFAAVGPVDRRYRSITARSVQQHMRAVSRFPRT